MEPDKAKLKIHNLERHDCIVFLLGAGTSADYGFPLWDQLRNILQEDIQSLLNGEKNKWYMGDFSEKELDDLRKWKDILNKIDWSQSTIDREIYRNGKIKSTLLKLLGLVITDCERKDGGKENEELKWVEILAKNFADYFIRERKNNNLNGHANFIENFLINKVHIVSLNYDRSFEYHFSKVFKKYLEEGLDENNSDWKKFYNKLCWEVLHPHGALSIVPPSEQDFKVHVIHQTYKYYAEGGSIYRSYGNKNDIYSSFAEVDDLAHEINGSPGSAYHKAQALIEKADVIICMGLSPMGITNSHFIFPDNSIYFFSNREEERREINKKITSSHQLYLGLHCREIMDLL